jgi:hypothetical protein
MDRQERTAMTAEHWAEIPGWEGIYAINRNGQVRSLDRDVAMTNRWGDEMTRRVPERILKPSHGIRGRLRVNLFRDGRACHRLISHRAIKMDSQDKRVKFVHALIDAYPTAECRTNGNSDYLLTLMCHPISRSLSSSVRAWSIWS